jgi:hypothetical protein
MKFPGSSNPRLRRFALPVAVLAVGAAGTGAALGATGGDDSTASDSGSTTADVAGGRVFSVAGGPAVGFASRPPLPAEASKERDAFYADVANRLGVDQSDLEQALESASIDRIEAANADGRLSDAEVARLEKQIRSGDLPPGPAPFGEVAFAVPPPGGDPMTAAADYLGLDPKELFAKLGDGNSLADIATDEGKSVDGLKQAILDNARSTLDKAVDAGKVSASDRDRLLNELESRVDDLVNSTPPEGPSLQEAGKGRPGALSLPVPPPGLVFPRGGGNG